MGVKISPNLDGAGVPPNHERYTGPGFVVQRDGFSLDRIPAPVRQIFTDHSWQFHTVVTTS